MNRKKVYKQKIEAELERVQAKSAEFEAPQKSIITFARIKYAMQVDKFKQKFDVTMAKSQERSETNKDFWDLLRYC